MMGLRENLDFIIYELVNCLSSKSSSIELSLLLSSRVLFSYTTLSYNKNVYCAVILLPAGIQVGEIAKSRKT